MEARQIIMRNSSTFRRAIHEELALTAFFARLAVFFLTRLLLEFSAFPIFSQK